jgi:hypothetical protein
MSTSPSKTRRAIIEAELAKREQPRPLGGKPIVNAQRLTPLQLAGEIVRREREPAVGGMTKLFHRLPAQDQQFVRQFHADYDDQKDMGSHGNPRRVLERYGVSADVAEAVHAGIDKDYVAAELQRRRRKDNSDLTLPPLTRRDHLDAAIDAHGPGLGEPSRID